MSDHIKGENKIERTTPGPSRMLTEDEEVSLLNYIKHIYGDKRFPRVEKTNEGLSFSHIIMLLKQTYIIS